MLAPAAYILSLGTQAYFSALSQMVSHFPQTKTSIHVQKGIENEEPQQRDEASESNPQCVLRSAAGHFVCIPSAKNSTGRGETIPIQQ
jgi:hypothetical protein